MKNDMKMITEAYRNQELNRLDEFMKKDPSVKEFSELLLYRRNMNWANKLPQLMADKSLVVAVGAGHLPGERGVINLLRKAGYKVEPVPNNMIRKKQSNCKFCLCKKITRSQWLRVVFYRQQ